MSSRAPDLLSTVFSGERRPAGPPRFGAMIPMKVPGPDIAPLAVPPAPGTRRRTAIWEMHPSLHCSIIGTCLSAAELRRLLIKIGVGGAAAADDHALHKQAVALAGQAQNGGKFIQKALDRRHETAIKQHAKLDDEALLLHSWEEALRRGEIPGVYWAVLSHPAATETIMRRAFGDVHMLSHMMGAANRADLRRLRELEDQNAALAAKLELQQRHLRDGFVARDAKIRLLNEALSRALAQAPAATGTIADDALAARDALIDLQRRASRETARRERLEARLEALTVALREAEHRRQSVEHENRRLGDEIALIEAHFSTRTARDGTPEDGGSGPAVFAGGTRLLYVGGRAHQVPQLKAAVERAGGVFLYHDGGIEHATALLPGLVSRADCAALPIDCVSHDAMATVKRLCRQAGKPFIPVRTSSLAALLAALATLRAAPQAAAE